MLLCEDERILAAEKNLLLDYGSYQTSSTTLTTIHDYGNIPVPAGGALVYFSCWAELVAITDPNPLAYADFILQIAGGPAAGKHIIVSTQTPVSPIITSTTTSNGATDGTTVIDSSRTEADNYWNGKYLRITSGPLSGQICLITTWTLSTHTFFFSSGFSSEVLAGATYDIESGAGTTITGTAIGVLGSAVWLPAGSYDISVQGRVDNAACIAIVYGISVGTTSFNDLVASAFQNYTASSNNISLTVAARNTPLGPLNQAVYAVTIGSNKQWGSGLTVQVDGVTQSFADEDAGVGGTGTYVYKLFVPLSVGSSHTITLNLSGGASVYASVVACPWILTRSTTSRTGHSPVTLDFGQNSTLYTQLGSLFYDTTKDAYIGKMRGVSYGASDFPASGIAEVGVLSFSYNFTSQNVSTASFLVDGLGGCIDNIGVDMA